MTEPTLEEKLEQLPLARPSATLDERISALCATQATAAGRRRWIGWGSAAMAAGVLIGLVAWSAWVGLLSQSDPGPDALADQSAHSPAPAVDKRRPTANDLASDDPSGEPHAATVARQPQPSPTADAALRIEQTSVRLINDGLVVFDDRPPAYRIRRLVDRRIWWNDSAGQPQFQLIAPTEQVLLVQAPVY